MDSDTLDKSRLEPLSLEIADLLEREFPKAVLSNRELFLQARWSSANPSVQDDLVLDTENYPSLYWYGGYFFDIFESRANTAKELALFLEAFFEEKIVLTRHRDGNSGGPIWRDDETSQDSLTSPEIHIRSWKGTFDRDAAENPM